MRGGSFNQNWGRGYGMMGSGYGLVGLNAGFGWASGLIMLLTVLLLMSGIAAAIKYLFKK